MFIDLYDFMDNSGLWSVGEGVTDLKPGDHVLPVFTVMQGLYSLQIRRE